MSKLDHDRLILIQLYDLYFPLLSQKQQAYFEQYYFNDLSLSEIAQTNGVSRPAVVDVLKKASIQLNDYETKLNLYKKIEATKTFLLDRKDEEIWKKINEIFKTN